LGDAAEPLDLERAPQVDHRTHAELHERLVVGLAEPVQRVRAEQPPPAHRATVEAGVSADVAEVVGSVETEIPGVRVGYHTPNLISIRGTRLPARAVSGMLHSVTRLVLIIGT